jgi:hypothetical protein
VSWKSASLLSALLCASAVLNGCGVDSVDHSITGALALRGMVHGGQQPVTGSVIQLYTVGSGGNGSAATAMLTLPVTSQADGSFDITGDYACGKDALGVDIGSPSNQVYIVASGGNPGLSAGTDNTALVMMAALGDCANLPSASYVEINEVTTVAAVWALAPFMTSYAIVGATATSVGASSTNISGIENAFLDAGLLADTTTGLAATLPANLSIETDKLYALADAIASCVNSDGTTGCAKLFTAATSSGVTAPTDTLTAALDIVTHPGTNMEGVFNAISGFRPFATAYTQAPNDWTMSLTITGGGLRLPKALAIDKESNVWVAGQDGPLSAFGPQGAPLSDTGYGITSSVSYLTQTDSIAVDSDGDIWITNFNADYNLPGSVVEFHGSNATSPNSPGDVFQYPGYTAGLSYPTAVAADTNHTVYIANNGDGSATTYNSSGGLVSADLGYGLARPGMPLAIAVDSTGGFWLPDSASTVWHVSADGSTLLSHADCCYNAYGVATDAAGNVWVSNYLDSSFSEVGSDGSVKLMRITRGGITYPQAVAVDGGQNVWFANFGAGTISEIAGSTSAVPGTGISPDAGTDSIGGYGLDIALVEPAGITPDRSGNIWVANGGYSNVIMFFGLAVPTITPLQPVPTAP